MIFYGVPKLCGTFFDYQLFALDSKLIDVSEFELAWYYFERTDGRNYFPVLWNLYRIIASTPETYYVASLILLRYSTGFYPQFIF